MDHKDTSVSPGKMLRIAVLTVGASFAASSWAVGPGGVVGGEGGVAGLPTGYQQLDVDGDGYLTKQELEKHQQALSKATENFQEYDNDADGKLDREEFARFEEAAGISREGMGPGDKDWEPGDKAK